MFDNHKIPCIVFMLYNSAFLVTYSFYSFVVTFQLLVRFNHSVCVLFITVFFCFLFYEFQLLKFQKNRDHSSQSLIDLD